MIYNGLFYYPKNSIQQLICLDTTETSKDNVSLFCSLADAETARTLERLDDPDFNQICQPTPPESKNNRVPRGYRKVDGRQNNRANPDYGRVFTPFTRILPADYADGISKPRAATNGGELPNARHVSLTLFTDEDHPSKDLSHMVMIFGQFINHDMNLGAQPNIDCSKTCGLSGECFGIPIPQGDSVFLNRNRKCIQVKRDVPFCGSKASREQVNSRTPFLDASAVYSELPDKFQSLRDPFDKALLIETPVKGGMNLLSKQKGGFCRSPDVVNKPCFVAGDVRVNENPGNYVRFFFTIIDSFRPQRTFPKFSGSETQSIVTKCFFCC